MVAVVVGAAAPVHALQDIDVARPARRGDGVSRRYQTCAAPGLTIAELSRLICVGVPSRKRMPTPLGSFEASKFDCHQFARAHRLPAAISASIAPVESPVTVAMSARCRVSVASTAPPVKNCVLATPVSGGTGAVDLTAWPPLSAVQPVEAPDSAPGLVRVTG